MLKFALVSNELALGEIKVFNLEVDGIDQFEAFEGSIEDKHYSQFKSLAATISQISENKKPPNHGKRRKIKGLENAAEMRTKNLRLYYLVIKEHGITICIGGYKKSQKKDIKRLKKLSKAIYKQIDDHGRLKIKQKTKTDQGESSEES